MAGIGFRLQSLVARGSILEASTAYLSATIITAGPWLSGVAALLILKNTSASYLSEANRALLFATIVTTFAASLIVAGGPQMLITRYVSDRLYTKDSASIAPTSTGVLFLLIPFTVLASPFLLFSPFSFQYRLLVTTLFLTLSMTWILMLFLSAIYRYLYIVLVFAFCYGFSIIASLILGLHYGLLGSLGGFTAGQILCLAIVIVLIYQEFPSEKSVSFAYLGYIRKYWNLLLIGAFYAISVWIDSFLFWISPHSSVISGFYHLFPPYDTAKFIAALSTIPAAVIFVIHLETDFDRHYQRFYSLIHHKGTLTHMIQAREGMRKAVREGIILLLKVQGLFAIFLCLIAQDIATFFGLSPAWIPLLCMNILAGTCQFIVFVAMLLLLYIDQRRTTLVLVSMFILLNITLTLLTIRLGPSLYGAGNLFSAALTAIIGLALLNNRLKHLERLTFMTQKML